MPKLNQILAVVNGKKSRAQSGLTQLYHKIQKKDLLGGITRTYRPKDEDGEQLPPESKHVQVTVADTLKATRTILAELYDAVACQDFANTKAMASVVINSEVLLGPVPVTYLLFLEKQLIDLHTMIEKLPTLDPAFEWQWSGEANCWKTPPVETTRGKKVPRNHVVAAATKEHPEQVQVYNEDVIVGYWSATMFNGGLLAVDKAALIGRVRALQDAVKMAREEANSIDVENQEVAKPLFDYIFGNTR